MTPAELKQHYLIGNPDGHFFDRGSMAFFGDTMNNYAVRGPVMLETWGGPVECWELYRKKPVNHGLQASAFFDTIHFKKRFAKERGPFA